MKKLILLISIFSFILPITQAEARHSNCFLGFLFGCPHRYHKHIKKYKIKKYKKSQTYIYKRIPDKEEKNNNNKPVKEEFQREEIPSYDHQGPILPLK